MYIGASIRGPNSKSDPNQNVPRLIKLISFGSNLFGYSRWNCDFFLEVRVKLLGRIRTLLLMLMTQVFA